MNPPLGPLDGAARPPADVEARDPRGGTESVVATVTLLIPEFQIVQVETMEGRCLALTPRTAGVDLDALQVGQKVRCVVTLIQPRVIQAERVA